MLTGKIIRISFGPSGWKLNIDGMIKKFESDRAMNNWLVGIVDKVRDKKKKVLLLEDIGKFIKHPCLKQNNP